MDRIFSVEVNVSPLSGRAQGNDRRTAALVPAHPPSSFESEEPSSPPPTAIADSLLLSTA